MAQTVSGHDTSPSQSVSEDVLRCGLGEGEADGQALEEIS